MGLTKELEIAQQEKNDIKLETANLLSNLKNETLYKENLVDKRVITKFLLNYFDKGTTFVVKMQILDTLGSILSLNQVQRKKLGLYKIVLEKQEEK